MVGLCTLVYYCQRNVFFLKVQKQLFSPRENPKEKIKFEFFSPCERDKEKNFFFLLEKEKRKKPFYCCRSGHIVNRIVTALAT